MSDSICEHVMNWKKAHPSYHEEIKEMKLPTKK